MGLACRNEWLWMHGGVGERTRAPGISYLGGAGRQGRLEVPLCCRPPTHLAAVVRMEPSQAVGVGQEDQGPQWVSGGGGPRPV